MLLHSNILNCLTETKEFLNFSFENNSSRNNHVIHTHHQMHYFLSAEVLSLSVDSLAFVFPLPGLILEWGLYLLNSRCWARRVMWTLWEDLAGQRGSEGTYYAFRNTFRQLRLISEDSGRHESKYWSHAVKPRRELKLLYLLRIYNWCTIKVSSHLLQYFFLWFVYNFDEFLRALVPTYYQLLLTLQN